MSRMKVAIVGFGKERDCEGGGGWCQLQRLLRSYLRASYPFLSDVDAIFQLGHQLCG